MEGGIGGMRSDDGGWCWEGAGMMTCRCTDDGDGDQAEVGRLNRRMEGCDVVGDERVLDWALAVGWSVLMGWNGQVAVGNSGCTDVHGFCCAVQESDGSAWRVGLGRREAEQVR